MSLYWKDGLICMTPSSNIRAEWDKFIATLGEDGIKTLREAGIDPQNPEALMLPEFHRTMDTSERYGRSGRGEMGNRSDNSHSNSISSYFHRITAKACIDAEKEHEKQDPVEVFAVQVARSIIEAFDCSRSTEVRFHCDCMRLALGDASMVSQKDVCAKYNVSKATLSWHVRKIQKRLSLPKCIFNGNRTK